MFRYVRINSIPGFTNVRYFYWFDKEHNRVLSFPKKLQSFDPNVSSILSSDYIIGSRQCGDVRYNFVTNSRYNQSAQLRKIVHALTKMNQRPATIAVAQEVSKATAADTKYAVIRVSNNILVSKNLTLDAAKADIERRIKDSGGSYMLVSIVATAKASNCVAWG